jgi:hypothetical protein
MMDNRAPPMENRTKEVPTSEIKAFVESYAEVRNH